MVLKISKLQFIKQIVLLTILISLLAIKPADLFGYDHNKIFIFTLLYFIALAVSFAGQTKGSNWLRMDVFFLFGFTVVHFQWPLMILFGIDMSVSQYFVDFNYVTYGTYLSSIGGVSWLLGYSIIYPNIKYNLSRYNSIFNHYIFNYNKLLYLNLFLFSIFILTSGQDFFSGTIYKEEDVGTNTSSITAYVAEIFSVSIIVLTVFVVVEKLNVKTSSLTRWILSLNKKYLILILIYLILYLSIGDRGSVIQIILSFLILVGVYIRSVKFKELLLLVLLGSVFMSIVGIGRGSNNMLSDGLNEFNFNEIGFRATLQLANSARVLYSSIEHRDQYQDLFYGKLLIGNFLGVVPKAQSVYLNLTDTKKHELSSAAYFTYIKFGEDYVHGEGTTIIADIYINFGYIGVLLAMFLFGAFYKKVNFELHLKRSYYWVIIAVIVGGYSLYMGRANLLHPLKYVVWSIPMIYFLVKKKRITYTQKN